MPGPVQFNRQQYHNLPQNLAQQFQNLPPLPPAGRGRGRGRGHLPPVSVNFWLFVYTDQDS